MTGTFSSVALLRCLGFEKARVVLLQMSKVERFKLALDTATTVVDDDDINSTIDTVYSNFSHSSNNCGIDLNWFAEESLDSRLASLSSIELSRFISYITPAEAALIIDEKMNIVFQIARFCLDLGTLDHFAYSLAELDTDLRSEVIDTISRYDIELANHLQIRFNGLVDIIDLDYGELAAMLGGGPVEEIAGALLASGNNYA